MAQKFVSLEEAATQLGISKDRLNDLREDGKIRAYRDDVLAHIADERPLVDVRSAGEYTGELQHMEG
jgi:3-mercaptopyruvate sulfurtransferase SseA